MPLASPVVPATRRGVFLPLLLVSAAFGVAYFSTLTWMVRSWFNYTAAHGLVILAISVYMVWSARGRFETILLRPALLAGAVLTAGGLMMLLAGQVGSLLLLQYLSLVVTLLGLVLLLFGWSAVGLYWYAICYLIFMFPVFSEMLGRVSLPLQVTTARIAHLLLRLVGIPSVRTAQFIDLPSNSLEVARECNGVNHMMALLSLAVLLAWWTQRDWRKRTLLVAVAIPVAILANGLRVFCIAVLSEFHKGGPLHGPFDVFYVSFIFFFGMAVLVGIDLLLGRGSSRGASGATAPPERVAAVTPWNPKVPTLLAVLLLSLAAAYRTFLGPLPVFPARPLVSLALELGEWHGSDADLEGMPYSRFSADVELKRIYRDRQGNEVKLYIGYFPQQDQDREVVHYRFDPLHWGASRIQLRAGGQTVAVNQVAVLGADTVIFWYDVNGRILTSRYASKLATILEGLGRRRTNAGIVVVGAGAVRGRLGEEAERAFAAAALPAIQELLSGA
jgi:EpsI family protein